MAEFKAKSGTGKVHVRPGVLPGVREYRKPDYSRTPEEAEGKPVTDALETAEDERDPETGAELPFEEEVTAAEAAEQEMSEEDSGTEIPEEGRSRQEDDGKAHWYVAHTYSGYENKVKITIEKTIENRHLEDQIFEVRVPMQDVIEVRNGVRKEVSKKMFPGYVLVHMIMNDDTWYVVRNTRGVTGFVGPASKPIWLSEAEMKPLGIHSKTVDFAEGDMVAVVAGAWKNTAGRVKRIDYNRQTATIMMEMFGRETPVEISFEEVRKLN